MRSHKKIIFWGDMYQGGEFALQADCEGFDSLSFHQNNTPVAQLEAQHSTKVKVIGSNPIRSAKL